MEYLLLEVPETLVPDLPNNPVKKKRGRPRKTSKTPQSLKPIELSDERPKRRRNAPQRFQDALLDNDIEKVVASKQKNIEPKKGVLNKKIELDGNTVIITDELQDAPVTAALNIEVDFEESKLILSKYLIHSHHLLF